MLNVLVKGGAEEGFVLLRALEPAAGLAAMTRRRSAAQKSTKTLKPQALCSGPGKLAQALGVTGHDHGRDFCGGRGVSFLPPESPVAVETDARIGISRAQHLPWRFLLAGSAHISVQAGEVMPNVCSNPCARSGDIPVAVHIRA